MLRNKDDRDKREEPIGKIVDRFLANVITQTPAELVLRALRSAWIAQNDYTLPLATGTQAADWHAHEQWIVSRDAMVDSLYSTTAPSTRAA